MEKRASAAKADFDLIGSIGTTESRAFFFNHTPST
jgi:hypothetical protein